ncbi:MULTISPECIES: Crp/Fnr family transcriptional regulator [Halomonadaceae]|uniref:Crp/Fnr family transcriptional regulator n=2 Tax=Billgrantia TaxID=3137761 RepID=A0ABS9AS67_9GAMM|nr:MULTISPECIES: Crp/Fnr family transcriptional regulator [Halomonas]MCE8003618.1 Crp/Fnr family transcriptional regulator [Halomonas ethanolica]MCE8024355.1 Crp/Fnr family transcriptional regulator [Halomonas aerodenitrificans]MCE8036711.1 Crp/Fnr family transcriptional regulator [Halomonas sp. MCCC 1A11062]
MPEPPPTPNARMICKLDSIFPLSEEERQVLEHLPVLVKRLKADQEIVSLGERPQQCCLVLEGLTCVYKLSYAGRRQIMALHVPGDMPDLHSLHLAVMDISIASVSSCTVGFIQHEDLRRVCERFPRLTAAFWRETLVDASIYREWLLNVGQRDAYTRLAHLMCELYTRLSAVGLTDERTFELPITQDELADTLGISAVHVSRTLQALRGDGLIETARKRVTVPSWSKLQEAGEFDPLYLHLQGRHAA